MEYERGNRREVAKRRRTGIAGICRASLMYLACTRVLLAAIRAISASVSTSQTLARKRSKGYAPRIVAGGLDTTSSEDEQLEGTVLNETGAPLACCITAYIFTDPVTPRSGTRCGLSSMLDSSSVPPRCDQYYPRRTRCNLTLFSVSGPSPASQ